MKKQIKIAIRDDDVCQFTSYQELIHAYGNLDIPISFSVVPHSVTNHKNIIFPYKAINIKKFHSFSDNKNLINYLKRNIAENKAEILLHGITHEYRIVGNKWESEMIWKDYNQLDEEIKKGKEYLEDLFDTKIRIFVAPNNHIDKKGIKIIEKNNLNFSGGFRFCDRKLDFAYIRNFIYRWFFRVFCNIQCGKLFKFKGHKEFLSLPLEDLNTMKKKIEVYSKHGWDFSIYTHYWKLNEDPSEKKKLLELINYSKSIGISFCLLSDCFEKKENCNEKNIKSFKKIS